MLVRYTTAGRADIYVRKKNYAPRLTASFTLYTMGQSVSRDLVGRLSATTVTMIHLVVEIGENDGEDNPNI